MKIPGIWICCAVVIFAASNTDVAASEVVLMCKISRHALSGGEKKSDYRLRVELDDDRRTVKVDDTVGGIVVINKYSALSIEGSMGQFEFAINRETGEFARAVKTNSGAIVEGGNCKKVPTRRLL
jgi:formylmethanofuran dehydrogenase subunit C